MTYIPPALRITPAETLEELRPIKNRYVVRNGLMYEYYQIQVETQQKGYKGSLIKILKGPPVLFDGWVIVGKDIYTVTQRDVIKGIIRASNRFSTGTEGSKPTEQTHAGRKHNQPVVVPGDDQPGISDPVEAEITKAANLAWEEQIDALLTVVYPKTGKWEIAAAAES